MTSTTKMTSIHSTSSDPMFQKSYRGWRIFSSLYLSPVQSPDLLLSFTASINLHSALPLGLLPASSNLGGNNLSKTCNMPLSSLTSLSLIPSHPGHCHRGAQHVNLCRLHLPPVFPSAPPSRLGAVRHTFILAGALLSHVADTPLTPVPTCSHTLLQQSCLFHRHPTSHNGKALMSWNKCKFVTEKKRLLVFPAVYLTRHSN